MSVTQLRTPHSVEPSEAIISAEVLRAVGAAVAAVDLSAENEKIADIKAEIDRIEDAIRSANLRCDEIGRILVARRQPDVSAVADALLSSMAPRDAASFGPGTQELEEERTTLRAAMQDLRRRANAAQNQIKGVENLAKEKVRVAFVPLGDEIIAQAKDLSAQLVRLFAGARAMAFATDRAGVSEERTLEPVVKAIFAAQLQFGRSQLPIPPEISSLLELLDGKGAAWRYRQLTAAQV